MTDADRERGLYRKYDVRRLGGTPGKHDDCEFYVLDLMHDPFAQDALMAYAEACRSTYPDLAADLDRLTHVGLSLAEPPEAGCVEPEEKPLGHSEHCQSDVRARLSHFDCLCQCHGYEQ